jgi:hypothetical protein
MFGKSLLPHSSSSSPIFAWLALLYLAKSWVITDGKLNILLLLIPMSGLESSTFG